MGLSMGPAALIATASAALTDHTPNNVTLEQWGSEEAVVAAGDAPPAAAVTAWLSGFLRAGPGSPATNDRGIWQMECSFDGGGSWASIGRQGQAYLKAATASRNSAVQSTGRLTGTVTGDIQVRVMCADVDQANDVTFQNGTVTILVVPA